MPDVFVVLLLTQKALRAAVIGWTLANIRPHTATAISTGQFTHGWGRNKTVRSPVKFSRSQGNHCFSLKNQECSRTVLVRYPPDPFESGVWGSAVPVWQPAPVQPRGHRQLFQRIQVPPWAHGGEHVAETHITFWFWSLISYNCLGRIVKQRPMLEENSLFFFIFIHPSNETRSPGLQRTHTTYLQRLLEEIRVQDSWG